MLKNLDNDDDSSYHGKSQHHHRHFTSKQTDVTKMKRIHLPQDSASQTCSSSEVYIVRTKPDHRQKVVQVQKHKHKHDSKSQLSSNSSYSSSNEEPNKYSYTHSSHHCGEKLNKLISFTNRFQHDYKSCDPDNELTISTLSRIHSSLVEAERNFH